MQDIQDTDSRRFKATSNKELLLPGTISHLHLHELVSNMKDRVCFHQARKELRENENIFIASLVPRRCLWP
jgi:hypothetical protein